MRTGWSHFTSTKVRRYTRSISGQPGDVGERLAAAGLDWYWDAVGGLHAHCDEARLWEILSGEPAAFGVAAADAVGGEPEWISVTDIGAIADPPMKSSTVLALLRKEGLLKRVAGKDVPTEAARGLYAERDVSESRSSRFPPSANTVQRRWQYAVLARLRHQQDGSGRTSNAGRCRCV